MSTPESDAKLQELISVGTQLLGQISDFAEKSGVQFVSLAEKTRANRRAIFIVAVSVALDLVLTLAMILSQIQINRNDHQITALTDRLDQAQTTQRQKALCPLYQLLLDSKSDAGRAAAPDKKAYDHAFSVIQSGYNALDCSAFISGNPN